MKSLILVASLLLTLSVNAQIDFFDLEWDEALNKARQEDKLVFLYAYTSWCEPCQLLEDYTFTDLEVANFYNNDFIGIRMDMEQYPGIELAESYKVNIYPEMLFVDGNGKIVHRGCGSMDTADFLALGKTAKSDSAMINYDRKFEETNGDIDFLIEYIAMKEDVCMDGEKLARTTLSSYKKEELIDEKIFSLMEFYQWDIFSREFKYLITNRKAFDKVVGSERVDYKIYATFLSQYQEIYESEELHLFGLRALLNQMNEVTFTGVDTLMNMINLHYYELLEDWPRFSDEAIKWVGMNTSAEASELSDLAWKFYLYIGDKNKLELATSWAKEAVSKDPQPSTIDTYASILYKQGQKKKAIELEKQALELAKELLNDVSHYEHQLEKFERK